MVTKECVCKIFWDCKGPSIDFEGNLLYEKKKITKKSDVKRIVTKTFIKNKSGECRKIRARAADGYLRLSKQNVLNVTEHDLKFRRFNARFTNKEFINQYLYGRYLKGINICEN